MYIMEKEGGNNKQVNAATRKGQKHVTGEDGWTKVTFAADTGAFDHIMRNGELPSHPVTESEMSKKGEAYVGAGEEEIPNEGQSQIEGVLEGGQPANMTVQRGKVHRSLAAIRRVVQAGNRVVFDQNESGINTSSILNKKNGKLTPIRLNGIYEFDMWVTRKAMLGKFGVLDEDEPAEDNHSGATNFKDNHSRVCGDYCHDPFHGHA